MSQPSADSVAEWLLARQFHLTALELHMELVESGSRDVPALSQFMASLDATSARNAPGVPVARASQAAAMQQHAAIDELYTNMEQQDLLQEKEERLAVVEFELRTAQDSIKALKESIALTASNNAGGAPSQLHLNLPAVDDEARLRSPIKPYEQRALNYLVNTYLLEASYRLTSITFSDEVTNQNVESWEDVGANMDQPPRLLEIFRRLYSHVSFKEQGKSQLSSLETEVDSLRSELAAAKASIKKLAAENTQLKSRVQAGPSVAAPVAAKNPDELPAARKLVLPQTPIHSRLLGALQKDSSSRINIEIASVPDDSEGLVWVLGRSLPNVVPNVLLNKREELVPLILAGIRLHPDKPAREALLNQLFSLVKKPEPTQRAVIVSGCSSLAACLPDARIASEFLPQAWELVANKYVERRILVADLCGAIAPFLAPKFREAALLDNLKTLLEDKSEEVREAAVKSFALTVSVMGTSTSAAACLEKIQSMLLTALKDPVDKVVAVSRQQLLPAFCEWSAELGVLQSKFGTSLLQNVTKAISSDGRRQLADTSVMEMELTFGVVRMVLPFLFYHVIRTSPFYVPATFTQPPAHLAAEANGEPAPPTAAGSEEVDLFHLDLLLGDDATASKYRTQLDTFIAQHAVAPESLKHNASFWPALNWMVETFIPNLLSIAVSVDISNASCVRDLVLAISRLVKIFGSAFALQVVKPLFLQVLNASASNEVELLALRTRRTRTLSIYVQGVLAALPEPVAKPEVLNYIKQLTLNVALQQGQWLLDQMPALTAVVADLCEHRIFVKEMVEIMWDLLVHPTLAVRLCIVEVFRVLVKFVDPQTTAKRVLPALITLSSDPEPEVRHASIATFGSIAISSPEKPIVEKVKMQFLTLLEDPDRTIAVEVLNTFRAIIPQAEPQFRDEFIIHRVCLMSTSLGEDRTNAATPNILEPAELRARAGVATALLDAMKATLQCFIADEIIADGVAPAIRQLRKAVTLFSDSQREDLDRLIAECDAKIMARNSLSLKSEDSTRNKLIKGLIAAAKNEPMPPSRPSAPSVSSYTAGAGTGNLSITTSSGGPVPVTQTNAVQENKALKSMTDLFRRNK
ncbi:hypothetical protein CAOG_04762 [Capsaspora owczarzaki ATCC 30864]|uniref:Uncharacterized protein n=1 Tax=Capsaspora owczarzaki (strain ATCC 30864) TaxID=595528 RepID=A0A0D2WQR8_CAPO3|nr:hypothetical protein CAOG_04762 [Capsaspora owczarzaki ATCC 30864]KJE94065.1 hypothetical protein CAOG_004762 [Capsaspora owczarzaki ATCC 30864]|eukprot:XP_004347513.1 hypothetical protein CAOG_04762 [Capsaspora owczarzaki ATCC 30864]